MTLFPNLTPAQIALLHDILRREMLDVLRGRYSQADGAVVEEMYAELCERAEKVGASAGAGDATNREVVGAVSQGPNTSPVGLSEVSSGGKVADSLNLLCRFGWHAWRHIKAIPFGFYSMENHYECAKCKTQKRRVRP